MGLSKEKEALYIEKLKENGMFLKQIPIHEQTEDICLVAVKRSGWALEYVHHQTPEICLEAVKENGWAVKYVENKTEELCLTVLFNDYDLYHQLPSPTKEMKNIYECLLQQKDVQKNSYQTLRLKIRLGELTIDQSPYQVLERLAN